MLSNQKDILQAQAEAHALLSSYEGSQSVSYDPAVDPYLDFGGNSDPVQRVFANSIANKRLFTFKVVNTGTIAQKVLIFYSRTSGLKAANTNLTIGYVRTTDGTPATAFKGIDPSTNAPAPLAEMHAISNDSEYIEDFIEYCHRNPTRLLGIRVSSTESAQIDQTIVVGKHNGFLGRAITNKYNLAAHVDENTIRDTMVTFVCNDQLDDYTFMELIIPAPTGGAKETTTTIMFMCGASHSNAAALSNKTAIATNAVLVQNNVIGSARPTLTPNLLNRNVLVAQRTPIAAG